MSQKTRPEEGYGRERELQGAGKQGPAEERLLPGSLKGWWPISVMEEGPQKWSLKTQGISEKRQKVSANGEIYPIRVVKILPPPPPSPESGCDKGMIESKEKVTFQKQLLKSSANVRGLAPRWWWVKGSSGSARTHGRLSPQLHQHAGAQRPTADPLPAHVGEDPASSHGTLCDGTPATPRRPKGLGGGDCSGPWGWL